MTSLKWKLGDKIVFRDFVRKYGETYKVIKLLESETSPYFVMFYQDGIQEARMATDSHISIRSVLMSRRMA